MDFSKNGTLKKRDALRSSSKRMSTKMKVILFRLGIVAAIGFIITTIFLFSGFIKGLIDIAPSLSAIDVKPTKYRTHIYYSDNKPLKDLVSEGSNRLYVKIDNIPEYVQDAFIDIEDERFYEHKGIDVKGIFRAAFVGLSSGFSEGASTITQQLIKNRIFQGGMEKSFSEKLQRKIQEQYLAVQLENKMSKKEILEIYLNTINLGAGTYGLETACQRYFGKSVKNISISEAAIVASITQNPVGNNPITHPEKNTERRKKVLDKLLQHNHITKKQYDLANEETSEVYSLIKSVDSKTSSKTEINSYFVDALYYQVKNDLMEQHGYSESKAIELINSGGINIYSTQDKEIQKICDDVLNDDSNYPDYKNKYQLEYNITIQAKDGTLINKGIGSMENYFKEKGDSSFSSLFSKPNKKLAKPYIEEYKKSLLKNGSKFVADNVYFEIQPQTSFVLMDQHTGQVKAIVGGRGKKDSNLSLNRATSSKRQSGSTFKVLSTFLPAIDTAGKTLASVYDDTEYYYPDDKGKQVHSWEGGDSYHGLTSIRTAIMQSNNIVAVKTLHDISVQTGLSYLDKDHLNFTTLVTDPSEKYNDIHLSLALGGLTYGITNEELTAGYAAIASGGTYHKPAYYTKVTDHEGNVLLKRDSSGKQVMKETTAWLLTDAMKDVVSSGTGRAVGGNYYGTAVAGKTGTTSNCNDIWFSGYTPYYTASIWMGFSENNKSLSNVVNEKINWAKIMREVHKKKDLEYKDFKKPSGIVSATICTKCGNLAVNDLCSQAVGGSCARTEYFASGHVPSKPCTCHEKVKVCNISGLKASSHCKSTSQKVYLIKDETSYTEDSKRLLPAGIHTECTTCKEGDDKQSKDKDKDKDKNKDKNKIKDHNNKKSSSSSTQKPATPAPATVEPSEVVKQDEEEKTE